MWISGSALLENKEQAKSIMIGKIAAPLIHIDRKSTRLNSSHSQISYAVFCLKKKNQHRYNALFAAAQEASSCIYRDATAEHHQPILICHYHQTHARVHPTFSDTETQTDTHSG